MTICPECRNIQIDAYTTYLETAKGYSTRGSADIYPEATARQEAAQYEADVLDLLSNRLAKRAVGRAVLDAIAAAQPNPVLIKPRTEVETDRGKDGYLTLKGAGERSLRLENENVVVATGGYRGARGVVSFTPGFEDGGDDAQPGQRVDEVLLHELVHALGSVTGQSFPVAMGDGFDSEDEFKAILIANVYSSEVGRPLRRNHTGISFGTGKVYSTTLPAEQENPARFLAQPNYRPLVERTVAAHPVMARTLAGLAHIKFNPFTALQMANLLPPPPGQAAGRAVRSGGFSPL